MDGNRFDARTCREFGLVTGSVLTALVVWRAADDDSARGRVVTVTSSRFGRAVLALALVATVAAGLLAPVELQPAEAAFPGANGKIAFVSDRTLDPGVDNPTGDSELFVMKPDGKKLEQLTSNTASDLHPVWSADGNWIVYTSSQDGNAEIYMRTDGYYDPVHDFFVLPETRRLTNNTAGDQNPTLSPDGTRIAFVSDRDAGKSEIYVMASDDSNTDGNGDNQTRLTDNAVFDLDPAWSPDGTKIAFTSERDGNFEIHVMDAGGSNVINLTNIEAFDSQPNWSPDGSKIAFTRHVGGGNFEIYVMKADGSEQKRLTKRADDDEVPAWSPDGKRIAFTSTRGGGDYEIYVMKARPEGRKNRPKNLTKNDVFDAEPDWRPVA